MGDYTHTDLKLVGRHVPDPMLNAQGVKASAQELGYDRPDPVTGMYEIGVEVDGAFIPLIVEKASLIFDRIDVARQQAQDEQAAAQAQADQPTTGPLAGQSEQPAQGEQQTQG